METTRTVQTAFRFKPEMIDRIKLKARRNGTSVNAYVEQLIEKDLGKDEDRYEALYRELAKIKLPETISPEVEALSRFSINFSEEDLRNDERLAYILGK